MAYIGNPVDTAFTSLLKQDLTGASGTSLTLTHAVANANDIALYINNVRQEPTEAYSVNGTTVTLTGTVAGTDDIYVIYLARAIQTTVPPDGSVSSAKIANNSVDLTSKVTGILPVANGGTGLSAAASVPTFMLTTTGSHTVTNNSTYTVPLTVKTIDTHNLLDTSDYAVKFTAATAGTYFITGRVRLLYSPTRLNARLDVNDSAIVYHGETTNANVGSGSYQSSAVSMIHTFSNGDELKLKMYFLATANQSLYGGDSTSLHGFRIST